MCVYNVFSLQVYEVDCAVADPGGGSGEGGLSIQMVGSCS